jgi:hypothetical protein
MLAWPATTAQATFEPEDEEEEEEEEPDEEPADEDEPDDEESPEDDDTAAAGLSAFLSPEDDPLSFAESLPPSDEPDESVVDESDPERAEPELAPFRALSFFVLSRESFR